MTSPVDIRGLGYVAIDRVAVPAKDCPWGRHSDWSYALIEAIFPALFQQEKVSADLVKILGHSVKCGGLGIPDPWMSEERTYNNSKTTGKVLVGSIIGGTNLIYISHKGCVRRASAERWKNQEFLETVALTRQKELADGAGLNRL